VVRDDRDAVIRWNGLEHRDSEGHAVLIFCISLTQHEGVMEENNLSINIFRCDEEGLGSVMDLFAPVKVWDYG